jgi:hypothetical protein
MSGRKGSKVSTGASRDRITRIQEIHALRITGRNAKGRPTIGGREMRFADIVAKTGEGPPTVTLWADDSRLGRVSFEISQSILSVRLGVEFPSPDQDLLKRCHDQRQKIETACECAFQRDPSERVTLMSADFNDRTDKSPPLPPSDT